MSVDSGIKLAYLRIVIVAQTDIEWPPFKGALLRGSFGKILRGMVCLRSGEICKECVIKFTCPYSYLFESPSRSGSGWSASYDPHPFIIEPPLDDQQVYEAGTAASMGLILVGKAVEYLPYFLLAFEEMGRRGIGRRRGKFIVKEVAARQEHEESIIYNISSGRLSEQIPLVELQTTDSVEDVGDIQSVAIRLLTPTRLQSGGGIIRAVEFETLIRALLRRYSWLSAIYCGETPQLPYERLLEIARRQVKLVDSDLHWRHYERYSFRQQRKQNLGGLLGAMRYEGCVAPFAWLLRLGEYLHIGKGTVFGNGMYRIELEKQKDGKGEALV